MGKKRNRDRDRAKTLMVMEKLIPSVQAGVSKNWLNHGGAAAKIDELLLKGTTYKQLLAVGRSDVDKHLRHLRKDCGLPIYTTKEGKYAFDYLVLGAEKK